MTMKQIAALVAKFGGWMDGDTARFPSVYQRQCFEKELCRRESPA